MVKAKLEMEGVSYKEEHIQKILDALIEEVEAQVVVNKKLMAQKLPAYLTDEQFMELVRKIIGK